MGITMRDRIEPYTALIVQPEVTVVEDREGIQKNLDRVIKMIHFGVGYFWEVPVRLVILPEYFMQGVGTPGKGESKIEDQMKKAVTIPGPEIDQLGAIAKEYGLYICGGGVVEQVPEFPDRWFNTQFHRRAQRRGCIEVPQMAHQRLIGSGHQPSRYF